MSQTCGFIKFVWKRRRNLLQSLLWQKFWTQRIWIWYWSWLFANDLKFRKKKNRIFLNAKHEPNIQTGRRSNERKKIFNITPFFCFSFFTTFFSSHHRTPSSTFFSQFVYLFRISFLRFDNAAFLFILKNIFLHVKSAKYCVGNHIYKYCKLTWINITITLNSMCKIIQKQNYLDLSKVSRKIIIQNRKTF